MPIDLDDTLERVIRVIIVIMDLLSFPLSSNEWTESERSCEIKTRSIKPDRTKERRGASLHVTRRRNCNNNARCTKEVVIDVGQTI